MCLFSIIIPTYNRADFLKSTIQSVLLSDFSDFEIVVIDDGSIDHTYKVINEIVDPRLRYYYQENQERGAARNHGVREAYGEYVFFLDSDDSISSDYLSYAKKLIYSSNCELNFFHIPFKKKNKYNIERQNFCGCQVFVKKQIALRYPFSENRKLSFGEDWLFNLKINSRYKLFVANQAKSTFRIHNERSMILDLDKILLSLDTLIEELKKDKLLNKNHTLIKNINYEILSYCSFHYILIGKVKNSIKCYLRALKYKPLMIFSKRFISTIHKLIISI